MKIDHHALNESLVPVPIEDAAHLLKEGACIVAGIERTYFAEEFIRHPHRDMKKLILLQDKEILPDACFVPGGGQIALLRMSWDSNEEITLHFEGLAKADDIEKVVEAYMDELTEGIEEVGINDYPTFALACLTDDVLIKSIINETFNEGSIVMLPRSGGRGGAAPSQGKDA